MSLLLISSVHAVNINSNIFIQPMQGDIPEDIQLRRKKNREAAKKCRLKKRTVMEKWRQVRTILKI